MPPPRGLIPRCCTLAFAVFQDLYWILDEEQQRYVLTLPPSAFDDDRGNWGIVRTQLYHLRGDRQSDAPSRRLGAPCIRGA